MRILEQYFCGKLEQAEYLCCNILKKDSCNTEILKLLGIIRYELILKTALEKAYYFRVVNEFTPLEAWITEQGYKNGFPDGGVVIVRISGDLGENIWSASLIGEISRSNLVVLVVFDERFLPIFKRSFPENIVLLRDNVTKGLLVETIFDRLKQQAKNSLDYFSLIINAVSPRNYRFYEWFDLLHFLRPTLTHYPDQWNPYLITDPRKTEKWKNRYRSLGRGLTIGISWKGGRGLSREARSIRLLQWKPLLTIPGINFINLQYGDVREELREIKERIGITVYDWPDSNPLIDLDDFLSKILALDLVISVDNSTIYFSGSVGIRTWVLLPYYCSWRWGYVFQDTPIFPSIRFFRQEEPEGWGKVFIRVSECLGELVERGTITPIKEMYRDYIKRLEEAKRVAKM